MPEKLQVLIVEDSEDDAMLLARELRRQGYDLSWERVETAQGMSSALERPWDVILSDYKMPRFSGIEALELLQDRGLDLPFILTSGAIGEETAVAAMRAGAHDYLMKDSLTRLGAAIDREIKEATRRREKLRAEREVIRTKDELERIFNATPDMMSIIDCEYRIIRTNRAMANRFGTTPDDCVGKQCFRFFHGTDEPPSLCPFLKLQQEGIEHTLELREDWLDGDFIVSVFPLKGQSGNGQSCVHLVRDVTEKKRTEKRKEEMKNRERRAEQLEKLGRLTAGLAHDFNNLLAVVTSNARVLRKSITPDDPANQKVESIQKAAQNGADLVRRMMHTCGKGDLPSKDVALADCVGDVVHLLESSYEGEASFNMQLTKIPISIRADATQLHQLVSNLVNNAIAALEGTGPTGVITISTGKQWCSESLLNTTISGSDLQDGEYAYLSVEDNGCGMDEETASRIFEPFFSTKAMGTGLGLAGVAGIAQRHNGTLMVSSKVGIGSTFKVFFPLEHNATGMSLDKERKGNLTNE